VDRGAADVLGDDIFVVPVSDSACPWRGLSRTRSVDPINRKKCLVMEIRLGVEEHTTLKNVVHRYQQVYVEILGK
jgi:hypothetical protein